MLLYAINPIFFSGHHSAGCGITDEVSQWMESIQNSAVDEDLIKPKVPPIPLTRHKSAHDKTRTKSKHPKTKVDDFTKTKMNDFSKSNNYVHFDGPGGKYSREANEDRGTREKRATRLREDRNTCSLYIQTDPLIWRHIREGFPEVSSLNFLNGASITNKIESSIAVDSV